MKLISRFAIHGEVEEEIQRWAGIVTWHGSKCCGVAGWWRDSLRVWYPAQPDPTHIKDTSRDASDMNIGVWLLAIYYLLSRPDIYPTLPKYSVRLLRPWNQVHIEYEVMAQPQYRLNKLRSEQKTQWTDIRHDRAILLCSPHHNI